MYQQTRLGIAEAKAALDAMLAEAGKEPDRPLAFSIVDDRGDPICFARMDGSRPLFLQNAFRKAYTSGVTGYDTEAYAERMKNRGTGLSDYQDTPLIGGPGGVVVMKDGVVVGGIGTSGRRPEEDRGLALLGLAAMKL